MERSRTTDIANHLESKVPEVTLLFWVLKLAATTLGETGGDTLSMSMNLGYLVSTLIFAVAFLGAVWVQIRAQHFHAYLYWLTIASGTRADPRCSSACSSLPSSSGIGRSGRFRWTP